MADANRVGIYKPNCEFHPSSGLNSTASNLYFTFSVAGRSVTFPFLGYRINGNGSIKDLNTASPSRAIGYYWSTIPEKSNDAYHLLLKQDHTDVTNITVEVLENIGVDQGVTVRSVRN